MEGPERETKEGSWEELWGKRGRWRGPAVSKRERKNGAIREKGCTPGNTDKLGGKGEGTPKN